MSRRRRYLHPDYRMTRVGWLMAFVFVIEVVAAFWILGNNRAIG